MSPCSKRCNAELPRRLIRYSCIFVVRMNPALNESAALQHFERSNTVKICNGIMFNFYPGLPHMWRQKSHISQFLLAVFDEQCEVHLCVSEELLKHYVLLLFQSTSECLCKRNLEEGKTNCILACTSTIYRIAANFEGENVCDLAEIRFSWRKLSRIAHWCRC